jgi:DNA recombination protein RmuC
MNAMTSLVLLLLGAGFLALAVMLGRVLRELGRLRGESPAASILQSQLDGLREQVRASLEGGRLEIGQRLEETQRVVGEVRRGLGAVDQQVRSVSEMARDLRGMQELLRSPKVRGGLGELLLADLLGQVLPRSSFALQHEFGGGERVDAVLRVGSGLVPVDAKFPLENFRRLREAEAGGNRDAEREARRTFRADVRRHVDAIAKRYVRPDEGTYEFAMMYVPAEAVYQEILTQPEDDGLDLLHHALSRQVVPVSPQSFYAYLQVIVLGLRGLSIEGRAREILERLGTIRNRLDRFTDSFDVMVRHVGNAHRQGEEAGRRLARLESAFAELAREGAPSGETRRVPVEDPGVDVSH